jgi:c-di-AMP phosphodiesterase-like protein
MIAGAQLEGATLEQAQDLLLSAIDNYLSDDN